MPNTIKKKFNRSHKKNKLNKKLIQRKRRKTIKKRVLKGGKSTKKLRKKKITNKKRGGSGFLKKLGIGKKRESFHLEPPRAKPKQPGEENSGGPFYEVKGEVPGGEPLYELPPGDSNQNHNEEGHEYEKIPGTMDHLEDDIAKLRNEINALRKEFQEEQQRRENDLEDLKKMLEGNNPDAAEPIYDKVDLGALGQPGAYYTEVSYHNHPKVNEYENVGENIHGNPKGGPGGPPSISFYESHAPGQVPGAKDSNKKTEPPAELPPKNQEVLKAIAKAKGEQGSEEQKKEAEVQQASEPPQKKEADAASPPASNEEAEADVAAQGSKESIKQQPKAAPTEEQLAREALLADIINPP